MEDYQAEQMSKKNFSPFSWFWTPLQIRDAHKANVQKTEQKITNVSLYVCRPEIAKY